MTPDPKLGTQGSWVRDPKNQVLFLPKPYRVGCPSIANRGRWVRFWNQFSCIDDPWPKTGYPGVMGSWPQKPSFVFAETISCWVSFHSKSGRWVRFWNQFSCIDDPWPKTGYPGVMGSWPQKPSFVFAETISCWVSFYSKSGSLSPILKPVFLYRWPLTQNWVPRGHGFVTPKTKFCFCRNHIVLGVLP